ncbi:MAG: glycosyltransferase family 39 protein [Chloroflexi bacterium]|nr:glycosyltransferase family 39 protein [Chloroflexota bacterium]
MPVAAHKKNIFYVLVVILILSVGLWIRVYDISDAPLDFHPTRQLHSALMARGMYYQLSGATGWQAQTAIQQWKLEGLIEPPVMEWLAALGYWVSGAVDLRIPRLIAAFFWLLAAIPLLRVAEAENDWKAALVGAAFFLFYPYGIIASRSFQPETLLVLFLALFLLALLKWDKERTWKWAVWAGLFGGLAILIKTVAVFFVAGMWLGWLLSENNWKKAFKDTKIWVTFILTVLPYALYLIYGLFINKGLSGQFSLRFFPDMWKDIAFYLRWLSNVRRVVSVEWLALGLLGTFLLDHRTARNILIGAWIGYILLGFTLPHHISTHDYYHLPLLLLVAFGVSGVFRFVFQHSEQRSRSLRWMVDATILFLFAVYAMDARSEMKKVAYTPQIAFWEKMGALFSADDKVVALSQDYGNRLAYWGWHTPRNWPSMDDIALRQEAGQTVSLEDYFRDYTSGYDYFLITDFEEYTRQPQLEQWLQTNFATVSSDPAYILYDLTATKE